MVPSRPVGLYWLSFLRDGKFAGACIVDATDDVAALSRADALGIHPGGEVALMEIDPAPRITNPEALKTAREHLNMLFPTREEIEALFGPLRSAEEAMRHGDEVSFACEKHSRPS